MAADGGVVGNETVVAPAAEGLGADAQELAGFSGIDHFGIVNGYHLLWSSIGAGKAGFKNICLVPMGKFYLIPGQVSREKSEAVFQDFDGLGQVADALA